MVLRYKSVCVICVQHTPQRFREVRSSFAHAHVNEAYDFGDTSAAAFTATTV